MLDNNLWTVTIRCFTPIFVCVLCTTRKIFSFLRKEEEQENIGKSQKSINHFLHEDHCVLQGWLTKLQKNNTKHFLTYLSLFLATMICLYLNTTEVNRISFVVIQALKT